MTRIADYGDEGMTRWIIKAIPHFTTLNPPPKP
jgi:hypothetical protein